MTLESYLSKEQARKDLSRWLDLAAHMPVFCEYDRLCREAYAVLGHDEYGKIYDTWAKTQKKASRRYKREQVGCPNCGHPNRAYSYNYRKGYSEKYLQCAICKCRYVKSQMGIRKTQGR